jgi:hypothetical protein
MTTSALAATSLDLDHPFVFHMNAMRRHYKDSPGVAYALPVSVMKQTLSVAKTVSSEGAAIRYAGIGRAEPSRSASIVAGRFVGRVVVDEGNQRLNAAITASQAGMLAWNDAQRASVNGASANLQATGDTASFAAQMNAQREAAKNDANAQIDRYYDNAIQVGMQYPETQQRILATSNSFGTFVASVISSIGDFFTNIVNQIVQWIAAAVEWIEQAARDIANWFENAASDIGDFFSSLF